MFCCTVYQSRPYEKHLKFTRRSIDWLHCDVLRCFPRFHHYMSLAERVLSIHLVPFHITSLERSSAVATTTHISSSRFRGTNYCTVVGPSIDEQRTLYISECRIVTVKAKTTYTTQDLRDMSRVDPQFSYAVSDRRKTQDFGRGQNIG